MVRRRGGVYGFLPACLIWIGSGCASLRGTLATDTGPSAGPWSTADRQFVHVGEQVRLSFAVAKRLGDPAPIDPEGIVDYCVMEARGRLTAATPDGAGHFRGTITVGDAGHGDLVTVRATAFKTIDLPDGRVVDGRWVAVDEISDRHDYVVAGDEVELVVYQAHVSLRIPCAGDRSVVERGVLEFDRGEGAAAHVWFRRGPGRGFDVTGPDGRGDCVVTYDPTADEIRHRGLTPIRFEWPGADGAPRSLEAALKTP